MVGTQAVIQDDVRFKKIGLAVIDEQHKFGVRQRALLRESGGDPHYLVMTATPIPRTVTMTLFGDLDVSTLADTPPGRQKVHTYLPSEDERERWWAFFTKKLREGRQGYVVTPSWMSQKRLQRRAGRELRGAGKRTAGSLSSRSGPWAHETRRERRHHGAVSIG